VDLTVRPAAAADREAIVALLTEEWGATLVIAHGARYDAAELPALVAERDGRIAGLLTYTIGPDGLEVVSINAVVPRSGAGSALLAAAAELAPGRLWLVTTNDNLDALRFYQRRGLRIVGVGVGAVDAARSVKPSIPLVGDHGIELHDELILELRPPR
jgi:ribosomal protein S18 acetylase RimI-like enzyme